MTRGPHMYWLKSPSSNYNSVPSSNPLVNLVSYEDAASAAIKVLLNGQLPQFIELKYCPQVLMVKYILQPITNH